MPVRRHAHDLLLKRTWERRTNLSAYGAAYVALAEGLGAMLITRDAAVSRAPRRSGEGRGGAVRLERLYCGNRDIRTVNPSRHVLKGLALQSVGRGEFRSFSEVQSSCSCWIVSAAGHWSVVRSI
jgi:hypothetical protein